MSDTEEDAPSSQTLGKSSPLPEAGAKLDLSHLPPIYVLATHFDTETLHELEEQLIDAGAPLTFDPTESRLILSRVEKKARIQFDLRGKGLWTKEVEMHVDSSTEAEDDEVLPGQPAAKRPKLDQTGLVKEEAGQSQARAIVIDDESDASESQVVMKRDQDKPVVSTPQQSSCRDFAAARPTSLTPLSDEAVIQVIKVAWFEGSRDACKPLPLNDHLILRCQRIPKPVANTASPTRPFADRTKKPITAKTITIKAVNPNTNHSLILERAKGDAEHAPKSFDRFGKRRFGQHVPAVSSASWSGGHGTTSQYAHLLQESTTEHDEGISSDLPEPPDWVQQGLKYSCQRSTPPRNPNDPFIAQLKQIKLARLLTHDEIGVRAYSTSIAALAAYPFKLSSPREIMSLPGCDAKIANLYVEWANTGSIQAVADLEADPDLTVLRLLYEIWGVGATTAREFYYDRGWRDLDDVVEFGWGMLSRVQQIGVKFYDEFLDPIPRAEVEGIAEVVHRHAVKVRDEGVQSLIVGGYRRGKEACGDVDMIVSHPDERQTLNIINDIVASLEEEGWITHTLLLSLHSTHRGQQTLPYKSSSESGGHGFDTLDKALVVWQDPHWEGNEAALAVDPKAKNPNIHRRVDIIIAPWRTVGCAVAGWSGGTTFQRDLRRYAKNVKGWKFDSSGVRNRGNGQVVDVEGFGRGEGGVDEGVERRWEGRATGMEEAERRVFEGMGLVFRDPTERCTG